jgi:septal ring-binding cell division protein DamX
LTVGSKDAALVSTLGPGNFSMQAAAHGQASSVLAEAYDTDAPSSDASLVRVKNFSVLIPLSGQSIVTAGFVIGGSSAREVLLRADGPALANFGIPGFMPRPVITLYAGTTVIGTSTNAGALLPGITNSADAASLAAAVALQVGAFPLASGSADARMVAILPAGSYTLQVTSGDGASGSVLAEVYELP